MSDDEIHMEIDAGEADIWKPSAALDPRRFEFLWLLSERLAGSSVVPESLRTEGTKDNKKDLPWETIIANVFLVVEQADRWNISPVALLACAAIVHGKLGFEGKVISAVLKGRFHIDLKYEWSGEGDAMKIIVSGRKPGSDQDLTVEGTVGGWKTTGNGSPWQPKNYRKMLAYRGAREWARLHEPAAILGILSDDELLEIEFERRALAAREVPSLGAALGGQKGESGFNPDNVKALSDQRLPSMTTVETREKVAVEAGSRHEDTKAVRAEVSEVRTEAASVGKASGAASRDSQPAEKQLPAGGNDEAGNDKQGSNKPAGEPVEDDSTGNPSDSNSAPSGAVATTGKPAEGEASSQSGDASPCPPELMAEYSKALMRAMQPKSLQKFKSEFWKGRPVNFDAASKEKLQNIYTEHVRRTTGEIETAECENRVKRIIAGEPA